MSTIEYFKNSDELKALCSNVRATLITPFLANNIHKVKDLKEAYKLAKNSSGTIELKGNPVYKAVEMGLPKDANQLLFNDGAVVGRCVAARKIKGQKNANLPELLPLLREAVYKTRYKKMLNAETYVGLDERFMVKAHLLIPQGYENTVYSWMLNFQYINKDYEKKYKASKKLQEPDIYVFSDPDWTDEAYPDGLSFFDHESNCVFLLGMRYLGEHKKGTLTLAWNIAARNGYVSCHGGMKKFATSDNKNFTAAFFGLSGSGKSTITHAKHNGKYKITVLHDDAFIINADEKYSIALEPAYFDKTADYDSEHPDNKFIVTYQNNGVMQDENGKFYPITNDIMCGNGRAIKSAFWSDNRVNTINEPISAIFWLMKDSTLPPVLKINNPTLASTMGATLATKRSSAEKNADTSKIVIEPYANPFRVYGLETDYKRFKQLFDDGVDCYILNTGEYECQKVKPENTFAIIESIVNGNAKFEKWMNTSNIESINIEGFKTQLSDEYLTRLKQSFNSRITYLETTEDKLPEETIVSLKNILSEFDTIKSTV